MNPSDINPATSFQHTVLGSDVAGVVVDIGEHCERLKPGDTVFGDIGANTIARFSQKKQKNSVRTLNSLLHWVCYLDDFVSLYSNS